jgi:iron uptake system EfeUOB component EfeO/EfeM
MTISGISSATNPYQTYQTYGQNNFAQFQQDLQTVGSALQSGDLAGAKKAFADLQQLMPNSSTSNQTQNAFTTDLNAVGQALQSGSVSDAQAAYGKLQQDMQSVQGHHHHHHHKASSTSQSSDQNPLTTDFQTLAQALQSGDLSGAQTAFAQLQQDFQAYNPSSQVTTGSGGSSSINTTA